MVCEIITIGTEVVMGSTVNSNSLYLSRKLTGLGVEVYYHTSVDDDVKRIKSAIQTAIDRSDIIITTGGLGPTNDDITKEIISEALGLELILDKDMKKHIQNMFIRMGSDITENNYKQAYIPEGATFINNEIGTAPGIYLEKNMRKIIMLPGPPLEMELMSGKAVKYLMDNDINIVTKSINLVGIGESLLETKLKELDLDTDNTSVLTFAKEGTVEIKIISKGENKKTLNKEVSDIIYILKEEFGSNVYSNGDTKLEETVVKLLKEKNLKIGLSESITGGMVSSRITKVSGASEVLDRSLVTYSNKAKMDEVGVREQTLDKFGAVSEETAYEMAKGLFSKSNIDIAASITGLAGPKGDNSDKPIGLVYICILTKNGKEIYECQFNGNRDLIRERATIELLNNLRKCIIQYI